MYLNLIFCNIVNSYTEIPKLKFREQTPVQEFKNTNIK